MCLLLGIDLGSTSLKAIIFDEEGNVVAKESAPTIIDYLDEEHPEWAFWHPDKLWKGVAHAVKQAVLAVGDAKKITAVAVDGFGMDGVPLDKDGNWLYPFISWHCSRSGKQAKQLQALICQEDLFEKTGKQFLQMDSIYRIMWMKEHHPEILEKTDKWILVEDFINNRLCGSKTIDYSMAWSTSAFDLTKKEWIPEVFEKAGIDVSIMPEALPSGSRIGVVTEKASEETGLKQGTQVILGGHDYICSALALGAFQDNVLLDVTGTWEILTSSVKDANTSKDMYRLGLNVESHVVKDRYCMFGSAVSADMVEWFRRQFGYEELCLSKGDVEKEWELLLARAENAPIGSNGALFLPHFSGAASPRVDDNSMGAFVGLNDITDKGCMLRAVYEGLTFQMQEIIEALEAGTGTVNDTIVVTGGAVKNEFWMQLKADISNKQVVVSNMQESSAFGAAIVAGIEMGIYQNAKDAFKRTFCIEKKYYPRKDIHKKYMEIYHIYKNIYPALKEINTSIRNIKQMEDNE